MKSLFDRFRQWLAPPASAGAASATALAPGTADADPFEELRAAIDRDLASGFYDEDAILQNACEAFEGEIDGAVLRPTAQRLLREALAARTREQRDWPVRTDCDRLDAAFAALEADGVIARQNFACCGTCASAEIWDEIAVARDAGLPARGYAYYHSQDTDAAVDGYGIYVGYGACEEGEAAALAVGRTIVAQIEAHGLRTQWDGTLAKRIAVALDWKRRR